LFQGGRDHDYHVSSGRCPGLSCLRLSGETLCVFAPLALASLPVGSCFLTLVGCCFFTPVSSRFFIPVGSCFFTPVSPRFFIPVGSCFFTPVSPRFFIPVGSCFFTPVSPRFFIPVGSCFFTPKGLNNIAQGREAWRAHPGSRNSIEIRA